MHARQQRTAWGLMAVGLALTVGVLAGCDDVQIAWGGEQGASQPRPIGRPAGRLVEQGTGQPVAAGTQSQPAPSPPAAPAASAKTARPASKPLLAMYQVVLFSGGGPAEAPTGQKYVRLQRGKARDVANLLTVLYIPSGPSGTDDRYTLVYPTSLEHELAGKAALELDVPRSDGGLPSGKPADVWAWAMGQVEVVQDGIPTTAGKVKEIAAALVQVLPSAELSRTQRWAAGMLAGELLTHRSYDFAGAVATYRQAEQIAEPGSYEQMAAVYGRGRALLQDGQREQARQCFEQVLGQYDAMRGAEVFERAREILGQWEHK